MKNLALKSEVGSPSSPGFPPAPVEVLLDQVYGVIVT